MAARLTISNRTRIAGAVYMLRPPKLVITDSYIENTNAPEMTSRPSLGVVPLQKLRWNAQYQLSVITQMRRQVRSSPEYAFLREDPVSRVERVAVLRLGFERLHARLYRVKGHCR